MEKATDGIYYYGEHRYKIHMRRTHTAGIETNADMDLIRYEAEWQRNWRQYHEETVQSIAEGTVVFQTTNPWTSTTTRFASEEQAHNFVKLVLDDLIKPLPTPRLDGGAGFIRDTQARRTQEWYAR